MSIHAHPLRVLLALAALGGLVYGGSLDNSFHYDDFHSILGNPHLRTLRHLPAFFADPTLFSGDPHKAMYRPLLLCSYALNYALGGYRVEGYHLFNLGLHVLNAWLVFWLGKQLHSGRAGWWAGLIFLVHPLAVEPVNYLSSRSESLAACFYLAGLLVYLQQRPRVSWIAFALGLLTKETAITLPLVLGGWIRCRRERLSRLVPYALIGLAYLLVVQGFIRQAFGAHQVRNLAVQGLTQLKALGYYLKLALLPFPLSVEHAFQVSQGVGWVHLAAGLMVVSLIAVAARGRAGLVFLGGVALPLLPVLVVPLNVLVNEHRLYLSLAFGAVGLGVALVRSSLLESKRGRGVLVGLVGIWGLLSFQRTGDWQDEEKLWTQALRIAPQMPRVHRSLAGIYRQQGDYGRALAAYQRADSLYGGHAEVELDIAALYYQMGELDQARALLERLRRLQPDHPQTLYNLGLVLEAQGDRAGALQAQAQAWQLDPHFAEAGMRLGSLCESAGDLVRARQVLEGVVRQAPQWSDAWVNLGLVYVRMEQFGQARKAWERALELDPAHPQALANLQELERLGE